MEKKRAIVTSLLGILLIFMPAYRFVGFSVAASLRQPYAGFPEGPMIYWFILATPLFVLRCLIEWILVFVGIGILRRREWARMLIQYFSLLVIPMGLLALIFSPVFSRFYITISYKFFMIIGGIIYYYYFMHPKVKEQFK